ncbi:MAG: hypothetical protein K2X81_05620 [Candidatus Obscuribacterales bacterium]|nr:hypothetical protein [Candidatus Obscuribacterales bacterium]
MQKVDVSEIATLLAEVKDSSGGSLPELYRIAWDAYLSTLVGDSGDAFDHNDFIELRDQGYFPSFEDDPDANDPVLAMAIGKHYKENYYGNAEGEFVYESDFQAAHREINQETKHFNGKLPPPYVVAWTGRLLGMHQCKVITDEEYEQLSAMLPVLEDNPIKIVEAFTKRYATR